MSTFTSLASTATAFDPPTPDLDIATTATFADLHGLSLLYVLQLAAGDIGAAVAESFFDMIRAPGAPSREKVRAALAAIVDVLAEVPTNAEPAMPAAAAQHLPDLDGAVLWHLARVTDLERRLRS